MPFLTCQAPNPYEAVLEAHSNFMRAARDLYAANVTWSAPARDVRRVGREDVIRHLLREASGMHDPEFTFLRRNTSDRQIIDEFAVRFVFAGEGIDGAPAERGDFVELKRVRILDLQSGKVTVETCIENWTVLLPANWSTGQLVNWSEMTNRTNQVLSPAPAEDGAS